MALQNEDHSAALGLLQRVAARDPDIAALTVRSLLLLRRGADARRGLQRALGEFCLTAGGLLAGVATEVLHHPDTAAPGWLGVGPALEIVGEIGSDEAIEDLQLRVGDGPESKQRIASPRYDSRQTFHFKLPQWIPGALLHVSIRGVPLLGSGASLPSNFGLDGRTVATGRRISGWVRQGWSLHEPLQLRLKDDKGHTHQMATGREARPDLSWPFQLDLHRASLRGSKIEISAQLPDGRWQPLPDTPLLLETAVRLSPSGRGTARRKASSSDVAPSKTCDVIIPVYRGRKQTLACIESVLQTVDRHIPVIVVNDATDDRSLEADLNELAAHGRITLLSNTVNHGFVASVIRGLSVHPASDAVVLNSDTLVFGDWLTRLRAAAYSDCQVGTVTPLTNSGTIASYPRIQEQVVSPEAAAAINALAATANDGLSADIPVGVGFCLYMRRDCLRDVGEFDAAVFGRGYGEETDFCMRARKRGWSHRLAADVYVYHAGGLSFGPERAALLDRSQRLLNLRYPGYTRSIERFVRRDPLLKLRRRLDERRLSELDGRFVLMTTLGMTGGVERFVDERCRTIREQGLFPLLLRPHVAGVSTSCELWTDAIDVPNLRYEIPTELPALKALLGELELASVEIQHFLHLDPRVIEMVRELKTSYDVYVHDYAWICPRVTLIDGSGRYCGEPEVTVCAACVRRNGSNLREKITVPDLRKRSSRWLAGAHRVVAPSNDAATRLRNYFRGARIEVQAHSEPVVPDTPTVLSSAGPVLRIGLLGGIGTHKGYRILLECARDACVRKLPLEFVVVGHTEGDAQLLKTGKVFVTGRYSEGEAPHLLRRERPDLIFLASVWPETWSYVLDEALETGLPIFAFDLGAIAERLRAADQGTLLPLRLTASQINDQFLEQSVQSPLISTHVGAIMSHHGDQSMKKSSEVRTAQQDGYSASVQILPLPPGLFLFSVKSEDPVHKPADGQLQLPALHVGLGPGVSFDQVEFIAGPSTSGAWLFAHDDLLIAKVKGIGATLVLNSVRGTGGEVLSIKVERLDTRTAVLATGAMALNGTGAPKKTPATKKETADGEALPMVIGAHIRSRGDMTFGDGNWAGRVAPGLWIESFSIRPLERFTANDIEYKGLTGSGYETAWLSDDEMCGTKGLSVPLVGFAVRLKPSPLTAGYDCEYSGYFKSGVTVGAIHNGAPCRSTVANDPLEGIQLRIFKRPVASQALAKLAAGPLSALAKHRAATQASAFSRPHNAKGASAAALRTALKSKMPAKSAAPARSKSQRTAATAGRSSRRRA
jgi:GT2 family glycosyltransferase